MQFFTTEAAYAYADLTITAVRFDIIAMTHYLARAAAFTKLAEPSHPLVDRARSFLRQHEWSIDDDWASPAHGDTGSRPVQDEERSRTTGSGNASPRRPRIPIEHITPVGALRNWTFHLTDADFFPSIPHGHWKGWEQPKLDPYRGWIYREDVQQGRVKREDIVELWNEVEFRKFAKKAIEYYIEHHPRYVWRVTNPRALPRRRRW
jgi:hypothetical protein